MEEKKMEVSIFNDVFFYVDRKTETAKLYVLDKDKTTARTIEEFANGKMGEKITNITAEEIYFGKSEIINRYDTLRESVKKRPILTYKKRLKQVEMQRDKEIDRYLLKYRYLLNSPKLDVYNAKQYDREYDVDLDGFRTNIKLNYGFLNFEPQNYDIKRAEFVIEGSKNKFLIPATCFIEGLFAGSGTRVNDYIKNGILDSIESLRKCEKEAYWNIYHHDMPKNKIDVIEQNEIKNTNKTEEDFEM